MIEQQPEDIQEKVKKLATESQKTNPTGWFDVLYSEAEGNAGKIPWARLTTHPYLQKWLDISKLQGKGRTALVIGCGLGDDAEALAKLDFQVTAFDISTKAIAWCQERFPNSSVNYLVADLLALDAQWHRKFDLVLESRTIQALPIEMRSQVIKSIVPFRFSNNPKSCYFRHWASWILKTFFSSTKLCKSFKHPTELTSFYDIE